MSTYLPGLRNRVLADLATQLWAESSALNSNLQVATILGIKVLQRLLEAGLLISDTPKDAVRVGFPSTLLERYFPRLFLG
jgi:hypothetical protein